MDDLPRTLSAAEVAALSVGQRRELLAMIHVANARDRGEEAGRMSLQDVLSVDAATLSRRRRRALVVTVLATVLLIPWTFYLARQLPEVHLSRGWDTTWVGFDILLTIFLGLTAFFAWRRRFLLVVSASGAGALLIADAWFDVTTAGRKDQTWSLLSALLIELPLAAFLLTISVMFTRRVGRAVLALRRATIEGLPPMGSEALPSADVGALSSADGELDVVVDTPLPGEQDVS